MSGLFGGSPPPPPKPQPPAPMPDDDAPEVKEAQRLALVDTLNRRGRDSTILTDPSLRASGGIAPGGDYTRKTTGGF
jgi:hypothetical protein